MSPEVGKVDQLILNGPLSGEAAVGLGLIFVVAFGLFLWREQATLGWRLCGLLFTLRTVAMVLLLWMLLGPSRQTTITESQRGTIAIVADQSQSMDVVDPPNLEADLRWAIAQDPDMQPSAVSSADRASVCAGIAHQRVDEALQRLRKRRPLATVVASLRGAEIAVAAAADRLDDVVALVDESPSRLAATTQPLIAALRDEVLPSVSSQAKRLNDGGEGLLDDAQGGLLSTLSDLAALQRQMIVLAAQIAEYEIKASRVTPQEHVRELSTQPRREKIAKALNLIDARAPVTGGASPRFQRFLFDQSLELSEGTNWDKLALIGEHADSSTDLTQALTQLGQQRDVGSLEAVLLLTDGRHNVAQQSSPVDVAARNEMMVYVVPIGDAQRAKDVALYRVNAPAVVIENDIIMVDAIVTATDLKDEVFTIELRHDEQVLERRDVPIERDRDDLYLTFSTKAPPIGRHQFELRITPLDEELSTDNNADRFEVEVTAASIKALVSDDRPRFEYQFLRNLLYRSETIEADELLFLPVPIGTGARANRPALPTTVDEWSHYDVAILGDLSPSQLDVRRQQAIAEWVRKRGGTLIVIAGPSAMPHAYVGQTLMELLPVQEEVAWRDDQVFVPQLTKQGESVAPMLLGEDRIRGAALWDSIYRKFPISGLSRFSRPKPSAHTLLSATSDDGTQGTDGSKSSLAFLCWHPVGAGRVVYLAAPETFRLRFRRGDLYHHRFWGQLVRWAAASNIGDGTASVQIRTDRREYRESDVIKIDVHLRDDQSQPVVDAAFEILAVNDAGEIARVTAVADEGMPGQYSAQMHGLRIGHYRLFPQGDAVDALRQAQRDGARAETEIVVNESTSIEMADTRCDQTLLAELAAVTGGQVIPPTAMLDVLQLGIAPGRVTQSEQSLPLWNQWRFLWGIVGCLICEWVFRKRRGGA